MVVTAFQGSTPDLNSNQRIPATVIASCAGSLLS